MEFEAVAFRNAAVSSAAGCLSCASLWLLVHAAVRQQMHQACFLPYIASVLGFVVLMLMAPSAQQVLGEDRLSEHQTPRTVMLWTGTVLTMMGPIGGTWVASMLNWCPSAIELIMSGLLLTISAITLKFARFTS